MRSLCWCVNAWNVKHEMWGLKCEAWWRLEITISPHTIYCFKHVELFSLALFLNWIRYKHFFEQKNTQRHTRAHLNHITKNILNNILLFLHRIRMCTADCCSIKGLDIIFDLQKLLRVVFSTEVLFILNVAQKVFVWK